MVAVIGWLFTSDTMGWAGWAFVAVLWVVTAGWVIPAGHRNPVIYEWYCAAATGLAVIGAALNLALGQWKDVAWFAGLAALWGWFWWLSRRRRRKDRAPKLAGAKSLARRARLVARLREEAR